MNILDYLATEFASFEEKPFNPIDSAILSQFCMLRAEGIAPALHERESFHDVGTIVENLLSDNHRATYFTDMLRAELYEDMFTGLVPGMVKENLLAVAASPRFREVQIQNYLSLLNTERQTQFAAMTFVYKDMFSYLGFRGTDSSFTGWREDFNMVYTSPVPAQEQSVRYVETVVPRLPGKIYFGGHSKGGNLAAYAALKASSAVQERLERVYSHDGPGFKEDAFDAAAWGRINALTHRTIPQESLIGMLMEFDVEPRVVKSTEHGIMQHSIFSWEVDGSDFAYVDALTDSATFTHTVLNEWLKKFSSEEMMLLVDALFNTLEASGARDLNDFMGGSAKTIELLGEAIKNTSGETRTVLTAAMKNLTDIAARKIGQSLIDLLPKSNIAANLLAPEQDTSLASAPDNQTNSETA